MIGLKVVGEVERLKTNLKTSLSGPRHGSGTVCQPSLNASRVGKHTTDSGKGIPLNYSQ